MKAWLNGELVGWDKTNVSPLSHSFSRGSAIFEVVDIVKTDRGPAFFGLMEHIERFFRSADYTFMELPIEREGLIEAVLKTARVNNVKRGAAKFFAYYSPMEFSVIPTNPTVDIVIFCMDYDLFNVKQEEISAPVTAGVSKLRKLNPSTVPVHAKATGNYLNPFLAKMEMKKKGYDDVIMLDANGFVAEGATSNVFFVKGSDVMTSTTTNALPGITRTSVIELLTDMGYRVQERNIKPEEFPGVDEAFYTGSVIKVQPIISIDGTKLNKECPGPVTTAISSKMKEVFTGRLEKYNKWLTVIG
ncbi:MAG: aminotransferase class IV [Deltaproteobacteria bacterium]|uniref:Aminotransferase class IV n=1 Tax=Candidatus Zymogenus saltonus TaxID=2844893 RepID=A0A9D8KJF3_9DELT|nr:aminotransferase class IV [Candidatus Zymogenus saltonus]